MKQPMKPETEAEDSSDEGAQMPVSQAMDLLDQHGIDQSNWKDIYSAIEVVYGEDEGPAVAPQPDDRAMMTDVFSSSRPRGR